MGLPKLLVEYLEELDEIKTDKYGYYEKFLDSRGIRQEHMELLIGSTEIERDILLKERKTNGNTNR